MMYILEKYSLPSWKLESDKLDIALWMLEHHVCNNCRMTKSQYADWLASEYPYDTDAMETIDYSQDLFPENYFQLSEEEKIFALLDTACGCEFGFETR